MFRAFRNSIELCLHLAEVGRVRRFLKARLMFMEGAVAGLTESNAGASQ